MPATNIPHIITVEIKPDGKISGAVTGVSGPACAPLSAWLDQLGVVESDSQTPDHRRQSAQTVHISK